MSLAFVEIPCQLMYQLASSGTATTCVIPGWRDRSKSEALEVGRQTLTLNLGASPVHAEIDDSDEGLPWKNGRVCWNFGLEC